MADALKEEVAFRPPVYEQLLLSDDTLAYQYPLEVRLSVSDRAMLKPSESSLNAPFAEIVVETLESEKETGTVPLPKTHL